MTGKVDKVNDRSAESALELLHVVVHELKTHMHEAVEGVDNGLSPGEGRALGYFARHPESTQGDLVIHTGRDKAQIARTIHRLRDAGLLEQVPDERDRRNVRLRVTHAGDVIQRDLKKRWKRAGVQAFAGLSPDEIASFISVLQKMRENLG